jgi:predicted phage baseplate assembly protein
VPLLEPLIDDRNWQQIVDEAVARIPRYTPEYRYTNDNASDPGRTLIELFAWMTEMLVYRLNRVPELNYVKFLKLLGVEARPAEAAHTELTFALVTPPDETVVVPLGTQVAVSGLSPPLVFETDRALVALGASLAKLQVNDGFSYRPTEPGIQAEPLAPFGSLARDGSALLLGFSWSGAFTKEQIDLAFWTAEDSGRTEGVQCEADAARIPPPGTIRWEFWGYHGWQALDVVKDETRAFTRSGHVFVNGPGARARKDKVGDLTDEDRFWIRAYLVRGTYERAPKLAAVLTNTVPATQATTVHDEVVGGSSGDPNQVFRVVSTPVLADTLQLEVDEGEGFGAWERRDDFFASKPDNHHYVLNRTTGEIRFGDGEHGRIPKANPERPASNVVARRYRYGGGARGNVPAEKISELRTSAPGVDKVTNHVGAGGGSEEESLDDAKLRAPQELQSKNRAVTVTDFETLALATPGARVKRAKALPLVHPKFRLDRIPGVVTVIVVPESDSPTPMPNESTLGAVCAWLNEHRLLTCELHVVPPTYRRIKVEAEVAVLPTADLAEVKRAVQETLAAYLNPLTGGDQEEGWEFGGDVYYSDIYRRILTVRDVDRVIDNQLFIWLEDERHQSCEDVAIGDGVLVYSGDHDIRVSYQERR